MSSLNTQIESLTIGTRGSPLALWQANHCADILRAAHGLAPDHIKIKVLKTSGDAIKGHLSEFGGKGLFTRELEEALLDGRIDLAVHSMKDVPTIGHKDLKIAAILPREDPRDAFICAQGAGARNIAELPKGAVIGTASIRRRAQLSRLRPDLKFCLLRGNVGTRLAKLSAGECEATLLAYAGLSRLGQAEVITDIIDVQTMLPAPAQGAVGIEIRRGHVMAEKIAEAADHMQSRLAVTTERGFLRALDGSCRTPVAALAERAGDSLTFRGEVLSKDGVLRFATSGQLDVSGADKEALVQKALNFGMALGQDVRSEIGERILWDEDG